MGKYEKGLDDKGPELLEFYGADGLKERERYGITIVTMMKTSRHIDFRRKL